MVTKLIVNDIINILDMERKYKHENIMIFMIVCSEYQGMRECKHACVKKITDLVFICDEMLEGAIKENISTTKYDKSVIPPQECCIYICNSDEKYTKVFSKDRIRKTYLHAC